MCIACRVKKHRNEFIHICYNNDKLLVNSKSSCGRGASLCTDEKCIKQAFKSHSFDRAFKTRLSNEILNELQLELDTILEKSRRTEK